MASGADASAMKAVAVIQARVGSSRLPAKALLPIQGTPMVILAAERARRNGLEVRVATSIDKSDDALADIVQQAGLRLVRGSLADVLERFVEATADLSSDVVVVRLTADNVFPDGDLIALLLEQFRSRNLTYLTSTASESSLPTGLSVEAFRCGVLREAAERAATSYEREHVTPWIRATYGVQTLELDSVPAQWAALRCTVDTLPDYLRVCRVFSSAGGHPIDAPWATLCRLLGQLPDAPTCRLPTHVVQGTPHSIFVLGTAQLGLEYGRANTAGRPSEREAEQIVETAIERGVTHIDTARAYGASERRIGRVLAKGYRNAVVVITKLDPLEALAPDAASPDVRNAVDASVLRSSRELQTPNLGVLLLHRAAHLGSHSGLIWTRLCELRDEGVIGALGVSVQTVEEATRALASPDVLHLQLPFNVLDWRWHTPVFQQALTGRPDVVVHVRSALLQGLLGCGSPDLWPPVPGVDPENILGKLRLLANRLSRRDAIDLSLSYVRGHPWVHGIVLGVETAAQLMDALDRMCLPGLTSTECELVRQEMGQAPEELLNPALWPSLSANRRGEGGNAR